MKTSSLSFWEYLNANRNYILFWFLFHGFALFVSIVNLDYKTSSLKAEGNYPNSTYNHKDYFFFTEKNYINPNQKEFWPFVTFYDNNLAWWTQEQKQQFELRMEQRKDFSRHIYERFHGVFFMYDISEFVVYTILFFVILYFVWDYKRKRSLKAVK